MNADLVALATDLQCNSISSSSISEVSSIPNATMARLSPTSIMSMPAWSATWALGKSCAVIMVMGSPLRYMDCSVLIVTGLRAWAGAVPRGECELHRVWVADGRMRGTGEGGSDDGSLVVRRIGPRTVARRARDILYSTRLYGE